MTEITAIVLAAGRATRFAADADDSKVYALLDGRPLVAHAVEIARRAGPVIVVTGQGAKRASSALSGLDARIVHNARYADGMASSIETGLAAVPDTAEAVLIMLADMPRVAVATIDGLVGAFHRERPDAVVPCRDGRRGNPVLIARSLFPALRRLRGDEGARHLLRAESVRVLEWAVADPGIFLDVDTFETLGALARRSQIGC